MEKEVNIRVFEENRANITKFGNAFGTGVFAPSREAVITDFNERKSSMTELDLFINRNIFRYKMAIVNIKGINYTQDVDGEPCVMVTGIDQAGKEISIPCSIKDSKFTKEATADNLRDAITNGKPAYFSSGRKIKEEINKVNQKEVGRIEDLIRELEAIKNNLKLTIDNNNAKVDRYYKELDKKSDGDMHIRMTIENHD